MATRRIPLLFLASTLFLGVLSCAQDGEEPEGDVIVPDNVAPHFPIIQVADSLENMHWFEVDGLAVEAIYAAPATPGRRLLITRLLSLGFDDADIEAIQTRDLFEFLSEDSVDVRFLVPNDETASQLNATAIAQFESQVENVRVWQLGPAALDSLWGVPDPDASSDESFPFELNGVETTWAGNLVRYSIRVAQRIDVVAGRNQEGVDQCLKLRSCELICDDVED